MAGVARRLIRVRVSGLETVSYVLLCSGRGGGLMGGDNDAGALVMHLVFT